MHIEEALGKFLIHLAADGRSPHTTRQYRRHVRLLARWVGDVGHSGAVEEIGHEDIARFLAGPMARTRPDGGVKSADDELPAIVHEGLLRILAPGGVHRPGP